jgi:gliding motility-associated-like protein
MLCTSVYSQVQINSISTTVSTCPNDGSITVLAQGNNPPLLYSITAGPSLHPLQTGNIFNSLSPGTYTIKVSDGLGNTSTQSAIVTGNYKALDFVPITVNPTCNGSSDGKITGNRTWNTGKAPFTWELIAPSPVTSAPQSSDVFTNLPAGNYTVRVTDACSSFRTIVATLSDPGNLNLKITSTPRVEIIGCDSGMVTMFMSTTAFRFPMSYKFETTNGIITTTTPSKIDISQGPSYFIVQHLLPNFTYGNYLRVTVTDACGNTLTTPFGYARTFTLCPSYSSKFINCAYQTQAHFSMNAFGCVGSSDLYTSMKAPVQYQFIDVVSNTMADSGTIQGDPEYIWHKAISGVSIKFVPTNRQYRLIVKDGCGNVFTNVYFIANPVTPAQPKITSKSIQKKACLDSAATAIVSVANFRTIPSLILLSGPTKLGSSKPLYTYTDTYTYPITIPISHYTAGLPNYDFTINNLGVGTYHFKVTDSCGASLFDSLEVKPQHVTNLGHRFTYKKGCLGKNELHYLVNATGAGFIQGWSMTGGNSFYKYNQTNGTIKDSILNLPSGRYAVTFKYVQMPGNYTSQAANDSLLACQTIEDTVTIEGYETPELFTANTIKCSGNVTIELMADSSKGVTPYQYEIISGPQLFPIQNGNTFTVSLPGIYTARIYDICGNASARQIFVDTLANSMDSIAVTKTCNGIQLAYPRSLYYTYTWTKPDHSTFIGERLNLNPITAADTGTYHISQLININGCTETFSSSYHVSSSNFYYKQNRIICYGDTTYIGSTAYTTSGTYLDTLQNFMGCDSIIKLTLTVLPILNVDLGKDTSLCMGQTLVLDAGAGHAAYFWNNNFSDSTRQSITAHTTGYNWVSIKNQNGCTYTDTIEIKNMYPIPVAAAGQDTTICNGKTIQLTASGGTSYKWLPGGEEQATIQVSPSSTTHYAVIVNNSNHCGSATDEVIVTVKPAVSTPVFENTYREHCFDSGPLTIGASWGNSYLWTTGDTTQFISIHQEGTYHMTMLTNFNCPVSSQIFVKEICIPKLFVPDAFSPNSDGLHDALEIFGKYFKNFEIKIFNRWGEIIFISTDRNIQWDGTYRGEDMPIGTYPWRISYRSIFEDDSDIKILKGSVTLIR